MPQRGQGEPKPGPHRCSVRIRPKHDAKLFPRMAPPFVQGEIGEQNASVAGSKPRHDDVFQAAFEPAKKLNPPSCLHTWNCIASVKTQRFQVQAGVILTKREQVQKRRSMDKGCQCVNARKIAENIHALQDPEPNPIALVTWGNAKHVKLRPYAI